jgi:Type I phosphodiesterase / nucleotide pyrophosphatase
VTEPRATGWLPARSLADVLPAAAQALGVPVPGGSAPAGLEFPEARVVVVLLVDGMGDLLLADRSGHAPFLRSLRDSPASHTIGAGFPTTTATSLGMFGTGLMPGAHGLVGLDVLDPDRDVLFNELAWDPAVNPRRWQPSRTVFEHLAAAGRDVIRIGPGFFDGSGLTEAVHRGGRFVAAQSMADRVSAALAAVRSARSGLVYVYWGDLDKIGHEQGVGSWPWIEELERVDAFSRRLAEGLPADTLLAITADHGMIDVPFERRLDVAHEPALAAGVRHVGGEARSLQLYCEPGAAPDVLAAWRERLGSSMQVLSRDQAIAAGWFGPVSPHVLPRIGDVVTSAVDDVAVVDSRTARPQILALKAYHGARTEVETVVPLLLTPGLA